jgi:hypothetical protein
MLTHDATGHVANPKNMMHAAVTSDSLIRLLPNSHTMCKMYLSISTENIKRVGATNRKLS